MKNLKLTCGSLAFAVLLTFTSCQQEDAVPTMEAETIEYTAAEYQLSDLGELENPEVTKATEISEFRIQSTENSTSSTPSLPFILKKLDLDENQRKAIREFAEQQAACVSEHREKVRELHQDLLKKANAIREDHVRAYRAGRISKEELDKRLGTLRERLQEQLNKYEPKQMHMRIMYKCRSELMKNIESVLNRDQLYKWNRWKQTLK
jgi:hypothetical protein